MTTFGFEAEFSSGVDRLITLLTERGFARQEDGRLHGYHCDCTGCRALHSVPFRAQRDSSCGGEIISGIFSDDQWPRATEAMHALQEAALDVDASIDMNCGMHVHIGGDDIASTLTLPMAWLGLEPILWEHVADGAWGRRRGSQNVLLSQSIVDMMYNSRLWERYGRYPCAEADLDAEGPELQREYAIDFHQKLSQMSWDRHCDLALAGHGGVYEMRIFNATRVAWRIELACRLAVALSDPDVAQRFCDKTEEWLFGGRRTLGTRMQSLRQGYRRSGRQYSSREMPPLLADLPISFDDFMGEMRDFDDRLGELLVKQTGYSAARRQIGPMRGAISNDVRVDAWNHGSVLAVMAGTTTGASDD
jgi:hypothetical protein